MWKESKKITKKEVQGLTDENLVEGGRANNEKKKEIRKGRTGKRIMERKDELENCQIKATNRNYIYFLIPCWYRLLNKTKIKTLIVFYQHLTVGIWFRTLYQSLFQAPTQGFYCSHHFHCLSPKLNLWHSWNRIIIKEFLTTSKETKR